MATPTGTITMLDVIEEIDGARVARAITLNDADVRQLAGIPSGAVSMNALRGKTFEYIYNITGSSNTNCNLTSILNARHEDKITVCIHSGAVVYSTSTSTPALRIDNITGKSICIINDGIIAGQGGNGGKGGSAFIVGTSSCTFINPAAGKAGGLGLCIGHTGTVIVNNCCIMGGGGGGGGGGAFRGRSHVWTASCVSLGGGGGGGGRGYANPAGGRGGCTNGSENPGYAGNSGGVGKPTQGGNGGGGSWFGSSSSDQHAYAGGGAGGAGWGKNAGSGNAAWCKGGYWCSNLGGSSTLRVQGGAAGGAGGKSVCGNSKITWEKLGTVCGARAG